MTSLLLASFLWAVSFGLIKETLAPYDPRWVAAARLGLAALVFTPWLGRVAAGGERVWLAALGAVQFGLMYMLYIASYGSLPGHAVALFTVVTPLYVMGMEDVLARRFSRRGVAAAVLAAAAGGWIVWRGLPGAEAWSGVLLLQGANLCFAAGHVAYRRRARGAGRNGSDAGALAWMYIGAVVLAGGAALLGTGGEAPAFDRRAVLSLLYLGLLPTGAGFWLWNRGASRVGASAAAVMNNLKIPLGIAAAGLLFGERIDAVRFVPGASLMLAAVIWALREPRKSDG